MYVGTWVASRSYRPPRRRNSAHPSIVPFQSFATADGWIVVACPKEKFWERLCAAIEQPDLAHDLRFGDFAARDRNRDELLPILDAVFAARETSEWLDLLADAGVPSSPVNDVASALEDPQASARQNVVEIDHPNLGMIREVASPLRLEGDEPPLRRAPFRGEHTKSVLLETCGYSEERIQRLAASGAFGNGGVNR